MTNPHFTKIEQYRDVESRNYYRILREQGKTEEETLDILAQDRKSTRLNSSHQ